MNDAKKILRWLTAIAGFQLAAIFVINFFLKTRLNQAAVRLRDALYEGNAGTAQVDMLNRAFSQLSNDLFWIFLVAMTFTCVGFGLLRSTLLKSNNKDV